MVRRVGKSPPGCDSLADPYRASSGPRSNTDPRSFPDQHGIGAIAGDFPALNSQRVRAGTVDRRAEPPQQLEQDVDVTYARHVAQHAFLIGQQAGGNERQRCILVPFDDDPPRQPRPPWILSFAISPLHRDTRFLREARRRTASAPRTCSDRSALECRARSRLPR